MDTVIPVIDGHNDLAWARRVKYGYATAGLDAHVPDLHTDLDRLEAGGVGGQFWSVWVDSVLEGAEQVTATLEQIDFVHRFVEAHPDRLMAARTAADVRQALAEGRIASLIGVEGGDQINGSLAVLREYARLGARYMTLTWSRTIAWADSATDDACHGGLTGFGRAVVREMNRIGMLVDLAHVAPSTMRDALDVSTRPVLVSHSGALALCDHPRNVPDDVIARIGENDGVVMVAFVPSFLSPARKDWVRAGAEGDPPPVTIADVADHIDHVREVAGVAAVGLGADYDGTDAMPTGLADVGHYQELLAELSDRGWSHAELEAVAHQNVLRVLEASDPDHRAFLAGQAGEPEMPRRVLVVVNDPGSGPRRATRWLAQAGLSCDVRAGADGLPETLDGYHGLLLLGGGLMPDDDQTAPWLPRERDLAARAIEADLPTLGICLGGQLLAHVAGGEVRAKHGPRERGMLPITVTAPGAEDAVIGRLGSQAPMVENHVDQIATLPEGAVHLASTEAVAHQAFRLGEHVRGLQFHPEVAAAELVRWSDASEFITAAQESAEDNTRASRDLFWAFAAEVNATPQ